MLWNGFQSRDRVSAPPCVFAQRFLEIAEASIFSRITPETTPAQFAQALESLRQLQQELEAELRELGRFHFAQASGRLHRCVAEVYLDSVFLLKNLALMQPVPPPTPERQSLSPEEVVNNLENALQSSTEDTYLGTDTPSPTNGSS